MEDTKVYYTGSDGITVEVSTLETTHLINAIAKKNRELFEATSLDDFIQKNQIVITLETELNRRIVKFHDEHFTSTTLNDSEGLTTTETTEEIEEF